MVLGAAGASTPAVYQVQSLTLNGSARVKVLGPILVISRYTVTVSGTLGTAEHSEWLSLAISSGGLTLNSDAKAYAFVTAPTGTVILDTGADLIGEVAADRLTLNSSAVLTEP